MRKFLELLKLQKNNNTIVSSTYEPMSTIKTVDTATIHKEVTPPQKSQKLSDADFDTFLWQCNSVSEERENKSTSDFQMQIDNPNDNLETGYHYAMQDIAKAKEKKQQLNVIASFLYYFLISGDSFTTSHYQRSLIDLQGKSISIV